MSTNTTRWPLTLRILALALLNLVLIGIALLLFAQWSFGLNAEPILLGPVRDRILAIASEIGERLDASPYESRQEVLSDYAQRHHIGVFLVDPRGKSLAG